jgi:hypothetical protein
VADLWGQFENPKKGERLQLEAVSRELVKTQLTAKTKCLLY